jgi:predicted O-methyltransferase YrrM
MVADGVERYLTSLNDRTDEVLDAIARQAGAQGLPIVNPDVGILLQTLATAAGAKQILEIGTANGYSGTWLARALPPGGALFTMEIDPARAAQARANFERAGVADRATVIVGDAARFVAKVAGPFDLIFQDGDKLQYEPLLDRLVALLRPGGLLVSDNVLWNGEVVPGFVERPQRSAPETHAIASYNRRLAFDRRLLTTFIPLRDGIALSARIP